MGPVIAAGGCADGTDAKLLMTMGAAGVLFGTRFVVSQESDAHEDYKRAIVEAGQNDTVRSLFFDKLWADAPHRTLINSTFEMWDKAGQLRMGERPGEEDVVLNTSSGKALKRYLVTPPAQGMTGDIRAAAMYAGTGVGRITDCPSAKEIIRRISRQL